MYGHISLELRRRNIRQLLAEGVQELQRPLGQERGASLRGLHDEVQHASATREKRTRRRKVTAEYDHLIIKLPALSLHDVV